LLSGGGVECEVLTTRSKGVPSTHLRGEHEMLAFGIGGSTTLARVKLNGLELLHPQSSRSIWRPVSLPWCSRSPS